VADTDDRELVERVRGLRAEGRSPKEIARATGARPARVTAIVRELGREAFRAEGEGSLVGAWVSAGWSTGLAFADRPDWVDRPAGTGIDGLVGVLVARRDRPRRVSVCGYLLDVYCLGVKNALGPEILTDRELPDFRSAFFQRMEVLDAPLDLARHLVHGAVDYARTLGFEPHSDLAPAVGHLGDRDERSAITFGRDGVPTYVSGPYDDPRAVVRTLSRTVGQGNFNALTHA
jgi:hypothetical protein